MLTPITEIELSELRFKIAAAHLKMEEAARMMPEFDYSNRSITEEQLFQITELNYHPRFIAFTMAVDKFSSQIRLSFDRNQ